MSEKITDKINALPQDATYFSLEFFPPKTQQGFANLQARLSRMAHSLRPLFVNVTWGAGGSTSTKSLALAELTQRQLGLTTCLHLTCTNMSKALIDSTLEEAKQLGIKNILALRGDAPRSEEYRVQGNSVPENDEDDSNKHFTYAVDLVKYIKQRYGNHFCIGVAGYPEGHADESHPEIQSIDQDLPYLQNKIATGADFIMTQLFFDVEAQDKYESTLRAHDSGLFKEIPIIPGLMPIQSYQVLKRTTKLSHAKIPKHISDRLDPIKNDDESVKRVGVDVLVEMIEHLKTTTKNRRAGFHFYTLNLEKAVAQIIERCQLIAASRPPSSTGPRNNSAIAEDETEDGFLLVNNRTTNDRKRRVSSFTNSQPNNRVIVDRSVSPLHHTESATTHMYEAPDDEAGVPAATQSRAATLATSAGQGALGREATWDDFPNGRFGDSRSPAYGEIDGYGTSLHMSISSARRLWGSPTSANDITHIFERHVKGQLSAIPWSEESLSPETETIQSQLLALIAKGWWTVASQPAVNGVPSTDPVFGWGPSNGFVFQKAFVEFFCPAADLARLREKLDSRSRPDASGGGQVTYLAANAAGDFVSSDPTDAVEADAQAVSAGKVNPVTWGAFTGKEIVTPTMVEAVSFKAWAEEAFGIWTEWRAVYPPASPTAKFLTGLTEDLWLVNVIHHEFPEKDKLWDTLLA